MNVALFGATGGVGRYLLERCIAQGDTTRVLVRDAAKLAPGTAGRLAEVVVGDVRDAAAVARTLAGSEVVFSALGADGLGPTTLYSASGENIVAAMLESGPRRLLLVTSGGVEPEPNGNFIQRAVVFGVLLKNVLADMRLLERRVQESGLDWTIVRPTRLVDGPSTGSYRVNDRVMPPAAAQIARGDVAAFMYRAASDPTTVGKVFALA
jgi:uncharacterized protein YbjT (DUF2867 family)